MFVLYALLFLLILLIVVDQVRGVRLQLSAQLEAENVKLEVALLYPFLKVTIKPHNERLETKICIFGIEIVRPLRKKKRINPQKLVRSLHASNLEVFAAYSLADPFSTGAVFGALNFLMSFYPNIKNAELCPDFCATDTYLRLNASVDIQVGHTIVDYLRK